jgi:hypothetical protein
MYSVFQHWDPLQVCVIGRSYPPEFYNWIRNANTRRRFERLAEETEQDYQSLIDLLQNKFGIRVLRPQLPKDLSLLNIHGRWMQPPVSPRDYFIMIQDKLWVPTIPNKVHADRAFNRQNILNRAEFDLMDQAQLDAKLRCYTDIFHHVHEQGNKIQYTDLDFVNGCFVSRVGENLYFATQEYTEDQDKLLQTVNKHFSNTKNQIVNAGGHGDATYCPVAPGLIISLQDIPTYSNTFPDWEVVYLPPSNYEHMREFQASMRINRGRWHLPNFELDQNLINTVEYYFDDWVGDVSETVFDVNILVIDNKNIVVSSHNNQVEKACARYGIEVHVVPFRHRYFWDAGIHCISNDLDRIGHSQKWIA